MQMIRIFFCVDLASVEKALEIVDNFGSPAGLKLNRKQTKAIWLGKWENSKSNPLQLKWLRNPVKILRIYVSQKKGNIQQFHPQVAKIANKSGPVEGT